MKQIEVKFFAVLRDVAGVPALRLEMPDTATVGDAAGILAERFAGLGRYLPRVGYAVNRSYVKADCVLQDGDELALIPPVSGGNL